MIDIHEAQDIQQELESGMDNPDTFSKEEHTKQIDCPAHPGQHTATLYLHPHKSAGVWQCSVEDISDVCDHEETQLEMATVDVFNPITGHDQRDTVIEICSICGEQID